MAGFNLGDVIVHVKASTDNFQQGLNKVQTEINSFSNNIQGGLKSLTLGFGAVSAGIAAISAVSMNLGETAGQYESIRDSFKSMTEGLVDDVDIFEKKVSKASAGTLDRLTILRGGTRALSLIGKESFKDFGTDFEKMAMLSKKAARATGQDVNFMFDSLILGVSRSSKMILDNLGINVSIEEANQKYAESIGKTSAELTMQEQKAALLQASLTALESNYGNVAVTSGGFQGAMQKLNTTITNAKIEIGTALLPVLNDLIRTITPIILEILPPLIQLITNVVNWFRTLSPEVQIAIGIFTALIPVLALVSATILLLIPVITALISPIGLVGIAIIGLSSIFIAYFDQIKNTTINWYKQFTDILNSTINFVKGWGGSMLDWLVKPFRDAWGAIEGLMNKIKDAMNPNKRHSPSMVDLLKQGVKDLNSAWDNLKMPISTMQNTPILSSSNTGSSIANNSININLAGAVISDELSAMRAGEKIGDAIINRLKNNVRF